MAVAAYAHEVGRELLGRTVLGEPLVFYRSEDEGTPVALADRCVHRRYPLPESGLDGDRIVCGYHGFTYDTTGVYVPGQQRIPRTARVASYAVVEQDSLIWVWIGDPTLADAGTIPRAKHLDSPGWVTVRGMEPIDADYGLLVDNLLDLSHETYLHGGYIGTPEVAETPITTEVDESAGIVRVSRHMDDAECPPVDGTGHAAVLSSPRALGTRKSQAPVSRCVRRSSCPAFVFGVTGVAGLAGVSRCLGASARGLPAHAAHQPGGSADRQGDRPFQSPCHGHGAQTAVEHDVLDARPAGHPRRHTRSRTLTVAPRDVRNRHRRVQRPCVQVQAPSFLGTGFRGLRAGRGFLSRGFFCLGHPPALPSFGVGVVCHSPLSRTFCDIREESGNPIEGAE